MQCDYTAPIIVCAKTCQSQLDLEGRSISVHPIMVHFCTWQYQYTWSNSVRQ